MTSVAPTAHWCRTALFLATAAGCTVTSTAGAALELRLEREPALYAPGDPIHAQLMAGADAVVSLYDWRGELVPLPALPSGSGRFDLGALPTGYYELAARQDAQELRRAFAIVEPARHRSRTFGVMTHFAQGWDTGLVPLIVRAGVGTVRDEQYWAQVEKTPGQYATPPRYQSYMDALARADIEPLLVLSFGNPGYDGGQTPHTPTGRAAFAAYGAEIARRSAGQVRALEVWNEINGSFCEGPCRQDRAGTYAALLAASNAALKEENPGLTVVGGAAVKVPLPWYEALIARGAARNWDAVAVHPYRADPEGAAQEIGALRKLLTAAGSTAPIWATEFGTGAGKRDAAARTATAAYLARMAVVLRAAGVQRMYWYLLRDDSSFVGMGLLRAERDPLGRNAPTPAYAAYATLIGLLDGADTVTRESTDPRTHIYRFVRGAEQTYVLWAPDGPVQATVDLASGGVLTNIVGASEHFAAGRHTLTLNEYPQYLSGAVRSIAAPRPDTVVANARGDFSTETPGGAWEYGAYLQPFDSKTGPAAALPDAMTALGAKANAWEHYFGDARWPELRVSVDTLHPARTNEAQVWAVRRYRSAHSGPLHIRGRFTRSGKGDGSGARILLDGKPVFEAELPPDGTRHADFDLRLRAARGARLDFIATPGPALNIADDAVGLQAWISQPRRGD